MELIRLPHLVKIVQIIHPPALQEPFGAHPRLLFRPDLQGLRALAVTLVVLSHAGFAYFTGGFIGVDLFFVLSGFLITGLLIKEQQMTGRISLYAFYARRIKRLLPAFLVMLAGTLVSVSLLLPYGDAVSQLGSSPYAATWTSNFYFAFREVDYFDGLASKDVFLHTWSLGVEEQFYLLWAPLLIGLFALDARRAKLGRWRFAGLVSLGLSSFFLSYYLTSSTPNAAYYLMPTRLWQFVLGALCQLWLSRFSAKAHMNDWLPRSYVPVGMMVTGLGAIGWSAVNFDSSLPYPGVWSLLPSLGTALILLV